MKWIVYSHDTYDAYVTLVEADTAAAAVERVAKRPVGELHAADAYFAVPAEAVEWFGLTAGVLCTI